MGIIDIAIIAIILLFLLIGFFKGFMKQILSTANWLLALVGAFFACKTYFWFVDGNCHSNDYK